MALILYGHPPHRFTLEGSEPLPSLGKVFVGNTIRGKLLSFSLMQHFLEQGKMLVLGLYVHCFPKKLQVQRASSVSGWISPTFRYASTMTVIQY